MRPPRHRGGTCPPRPYRRRPPCHSERTRPGLQRPARTIGHPRPPGAAQAAAQARWLARITGLSTGTRARSGGPAEEGLGVAHKVLVQRVVEADHQHHGGLPAPARPCPCVGGRWIIVPGNPTSRHASRPPTSMPSSRALVVMTPSRAPLKSCCSMALALLGQVAGAVASAILVPQGRTVLLGPQGHQLGDLAGLGRMRCSCARAAAAGRSGWWPRGRGWPKGSTGRCGAPPGARRWPPPPGSPRQGGWPQMRPARPKRWWRTA